jgi:DNA helicase HerA-like ATPase
MAKTSKITVYVGPKGSGKSFSLKKFLRNERRRFVLFDSTGEYSSRGKEGIPGLRKHRSLSAFFDSVRGGQRIQKEAIRADWRTFEAFCRFAFEAGNMVVCIEEVGRFLTEASSSRAFRDLCERSRHVGVDVVLVVSRPTFIPPFARTQVDDWVVFKTQERTDLALYRSISSEAAERIPDLHQYQSITL